jgi:hypothetical protein
MVFKKVVLAQYNIKKAFLYRKKCDGVLLCNYHFSKLHASCNSCLLDALAVNYLLFIWEFLKGYHEWANQI